MKCVISIKYTPDFNNIVWKILQNCLLISYTVTDLNNKFGEYWFKLILKVISPAPFTYFKCNY
jgi:hypothetical protein